MNCYCTFAVQRRPPDEWPLRPRYGISEGGNTHLGEEHLRQILKQMGMVEGRAGLCFGNRELVM